MKTHIPVQKQITDSGEPIYETCNYILSPILHKETYELTNEITLKIDKSYENNLRERNPQLGTVEYVPENNIYGLSVGDIVAVNHFTFYGDIGPNKSFTTKPHVVHDGKMLFKALPRQIFFKYNNKHPEPMADFVLCHAVDEKEELHIEPNSGDFYRTKEFAQKGTIWFGNDEFPSGTEILVLKSSFYLITLDRVDYFKVNKNEIVAKIVEGKLLPVNGCGLVEYIPEKEHPFLDLSMMKKPNNTTARLLSGDPVINMMVEGVDKDSGLLQVYRNQGVPYNGKWIVNEDMILYRYD